MKPLPFVLCAVGVALALGARSARAPGPSGHADGLKVISAEDAERHLWNLAAPGLQGRDTPSLGQDRAEEYIARAFAAAGLEPWRALPDRPSSGEAPNGEPWTEFLWGFSLEVEVGDAQSLVDLEVEGQPTETFEFGVDFHPLLEFGGQAEGELAFCGFGIQSKRERFDELANVNLKKTIAVVLEGEPRHNKRFEGPAVVTPEASLFVKLGNLQHEGVAGVVLVRRPPAEAKKRPPVDVEAGGFGFRHGYALWTEDNDTLPRTKERLPVVEMTAQAASRLVGFDVLERAEKIEKRLHPATERLSERRARLVSATTWNELQVHNVCGFVRGTDAELSREYIVVGAHHDHVGIDARGRVGCGADDNASGVSALIEVAEALVASPPRRSVILVTFNAEEDGLKGSKAFCASGPVDVAHVACMINLDMVGRGPEREVAILGIRQNPELEQVVDRARKLSKTGLKKVDCVKNDQGLFKRSDHFSFHEVGVPSLFLFEGMPISANADYHTWRDQPEWVDCAKIARAAELAYNTAWLLATDDDRPPPPQRR